MALYIRNLRENSDENSSGKSPINNVDCEADSVKTLRTRVSEELALPVGDIELVFCGRPLDDENVLQDYGIKHGSTVFLCQKQKVASDLEGPCDGKEIENLAVALQALQLQFKHKSTQLLLKIIENLIQTMPSLGTDTVAESILLEPIIVQYLSVQDDLKDVKKNHPALFAAAVHVTSAINMEVEASQKKMNQSDQQQSNNSGHYSIDMMSDDEDDDEGQPGDQQQQQPSTSSGRGRRRQPQQITADYLRRALAAAQSTAAAARTASGGEGGSGGSTSGTPTATPASSQPGSITRDMFANALQSALQTAPTGARPNFIQQLESMRSMGITDDETSLRALQATGGNVTAALELIFGAGSTDIGGNNPQ